MAAHAGSEKRGKRRRGDEDSIQGGGSISGVQRVHFQRRMGQSDAVEVRRRAAASGTAEMDGGRRPSSPELVATIRERGSTPERWDGREGVSHRIGFAGGRPATTNRGGACRRRQKRETTTTR